MLLQTRKVFSVHFCFYVFSHLEYNCHCGTKYFSVTLKHNPFAKANRHIWWSYKKKKMESTVKDKSSTDLSFNVKKKKKNWKEKKNKESEWTAVEEGKRISSAGSVVIKLTQSFYLQSSLQMWTNISFRHSCAVRVWAVRAKCCDIKENHINYLDKYFNHFFSESKTEFPKDFFLLHSFIFFFFLNWFNIVVLLRVPT